jgi:hypothetical protein
MWVAEGNAPKIPARYIEIPPGLRGLREPQAPKSATDVDIRVCALIIVQGI